MKRMYFYALLKMVFFLIVTYMPLNANRWTGVTIKSLIKIAEEQRGEQLYKKFVFHSVLLPILTLYVYYNGYNKITCAHEYIIMLADNDSTSEFKIAGNKVQNCHGWNIFLADHDLGLSGLIEELHKDDKVLRDVFEFEHIRYCYAYKLSFGTSLIELENPMLTLSKKQYMCHVCV